MFRNTLIAMAGFAVVIFLAQGSMAQRPGAKAKSKQPSAAPASTGQTDDNRGVKSKAKGGAPEPGTAPVNAPGYIGETEKNRGAGAAKAPKPPTAPSVTGAQMNMQFLEKSTGGPNSNTGRHAVTPAGATPVGTNILNAEPKVEPKVTKMEEESSERHAGSNQKPGQKSKHRKKP